MSEINPTLQRSFPPSLLQILEQQKREVMKAINCVRIGVIQSFDASKQTVTVKIAQKQVTSIQPDGTKTLADYPLLLVVPVVFPSGGGFTMTFPIAAGDECVVLFNDRELDNWLLSGAGFAPTTGRIHDLADGIAVVGLHSNPRALAGVSTTAAQIRSTDGQTLVELSPGKIQLIADEVVIHARNKLCYDAGGTGVVIQPSQIDSYEDGVHVNTHSPTPPAIPT